MVFIVCLDSIFTFFSATTFKKHEVSVSDQIVLLNVIILFYKLEKIITTLSPFWIQRYYNIFKKVCSLYTDLL